MSELYFLFIYFFLSFFFLLLFFKKKRLWNSRFRSIYDPQGYLSCKLRTSSFKEIIYAVRSTYAKLLRDVREVAVVLLVQGQEAKVI